MALAFLCSRYQTQSRDMRAREASHDHKAIPSYIFRAFVVDHAARAGSDIEAINVARVLVEQGEVYC
jgi:hypothetical protein